jgi:hypothetical protein
MNACSLSAALKGVTRAVHSCETLIGAALRIWDCLQTSYYPRGLLPLHPFSPSDKIVIFDDRPSPNSLILKSEGDLLPCFKEPRQAAKGMRLFAS